MNLPRRIAIVGTTGTGKTTLGEALSRILGLPRVELDALFWNPGWEPASKEEFRLRVSTALAGPRWVADGNYNRVRDLVWGQADTLVWLDYSLPRVLWQLSLRSVRRLRSREELWNGNRESVRGLLFSKDSLFLWALQSYAKNRKEFAAHLALPEYSHLQLVRLRSPQEKDAWLREFTKVGTSVGTDVNVDSSVEEG